MRFFNIVGAVNPKDHYFLPNRLDRVLLKGFIEKFQGKTIKVWGL